MVNDKKNRLDFCRVRLQKLKNISPKTTRVIRKLFECEAEIENLENELNAKQE